MQFRHLPVLSHEDTTHNLEQLQSILKETEEALVRISTQRSRTYTSGVAELTFGAGAKTTASTKVKHELGKTPIAVICTAEGSPAFEQIPLINIVARTATEFEVNAETVKVFAGETKVKFDWIAAG